MNNIKDKQLKYEKALEYEIFEKGEYNFAKDKIQNAKCIFDIWWHIWLFSKWCKDIGSNAEIHYFEPIWQFFNKAKSTLWNNKNIILNNVWIGSKTKNWIILLNEEKTMQSSKYCSFLNPKWTETIVNFITLKDYLISSNTDEIDVLKMDIEWMEFEVLPSRWEFEWNKIQNLIIEIHLLNGEMESTWDEIFSKIKDIFSATKIIDWWYHKEIFLLRANKKYWL